MFIFTKVICVHFDVVGNTGTHEWVCTPMTASFCIRIHGNGWLHKVKAVNSCMFVGGFCSQIKKGRWCVDLYSGGIFVNSAGHFSIFCRFFFFFLTCLELKSWFITVCDESIVLPRSHHICPPVIACPVRGHRCNEMLIIKKSRLVSGTLHVVD